ncbi:MAG: HEPN domain-containing protein [Candidatus Helarchaeota archaeon]
MNKDVAVKWFKQAVHDLEMAEKNITIEGYDIAAFLIHQAVEKLLKSIIALRGMKIPKIHYLDELGRILHLPESMLQDLMDFVPDYMFARYPDIAEHVPYEEYDEEIVKAKLKHAKSIFKNLEKYYAELKEKDDE